MHPDYRDIKKRIKQKPKWYDMNGVPRYEKFKPSLASSIYLTNVLLIEIACRECNKRFLVEYYNQDSDLNYDKNYESIHYGDPPRHDNCTGEVIDCIDLRVVEFWSRMDKNFDWERIKKYEREI